MVGISSSSPDDLVQLFEDLDRHNGPVELVLAGDFFDFLRIADVPTGKNRATATIERPEYASLFAALRRFATAEGRRVVYLPGNHDAEAWWNREIQEDIRQNGIASEFALSYAAVFSSAPDKPIYCEHGNEFDPDNTIRDYSDPLDTPLGDHIVTDIIPRLPKGWAADALQLDQIEYVFPLATIPTWISGRLFYALVTQVVGWLLIPLVLAYTAYRVVAALLGRSGSVVTALFFDLAYDIALLLITFGLFFFFARVIVNRAVRAAPKRMRTTPEGGQSGVVAAIRHRLELGAAPPLGGELPREMAVFVSGHTHAPSLDGYRRPSGGAGVLVNSGCWLRQLRPLRTRFRLPTVFANQFAQTHVRVRLEDAQVRVELWEHPRRSRQHLRVVERLAAAGRLPAQPDPNAKPNVRAAASV